MCIRDSINNGVFELDVEIPVGVEAEVELPGDAKQFLLDGIEQERADAAKTALILKSGKYQISSKLQ